MDFSVSEDTAQARRLAAEFSRRLRAEARSAERDGPTAALRAAYASLGLARADWPEAQGGAGLGAALKLATVAELACGCAATTLALDRSAWLAAPLLGAAAPAALEWLAAVAAHGDGAALAVLDDGALAITDGRWSGHCRWLPVAAPTLLLLVAPTGLALIESGLDAATVVPHALHAAGASSLRFDAVPAAVLALPAAALARARARTRLYVTALLVGVMRAAHDYARAYALEREVFGRPVAHHQAIAFALADQRVALDAATALFESAAWETDQGDGVYAANQAYVQAVETALPLTVECAQLLGAHGFVRDHPVEKWLREARALTLLCGGCDGAIDDLDALGMARWELLAT